MKDSLDNLSRCSRCHAHTVDRYAGSKVPMSLARPLIFLLLLHSAASELLLGLDFRLCPSASSSLLHWSSPESGNVHGHFHLHPPSLLLMHSSLPLPVSNHSAKGWTRLSVYLTGSSMVVIMYYESKEPSTTSFRISDEEAKRFRRATFHLGPQVCAESFVGNFSKPSRRCNCEGLETSPLSDIREAGPRILTRLRRSNDACNPNPCLNSMPCGLNSTASAGYTCRCSTVMIVEISEGVSKSVVTGWKGQNCSEDINECDSNACLNSALCENINGSFDCLCRKPGGFYYTGSLCEKKINQCRAEHKAYNITKDSVVCIRGNCSTIPERPIDRRTFACACPKGYEGVRCGIDINECAPKPCKNNATCADLIGAYNCTCLPGFNGTNCEINIDECAPVPCKNGGQCTDLINAYSCNCSDTGFKGPTCEINIDDCEPRPCQNNATCTDGIKDYNCSCHPGYTGKNCSIDIDECNPSPCHFGSQCYQKSNQTLYGDPAFRHIPPFNGTFDYTKAAGYVCDCVRGSTGKNCSTNIDDCTPDPCLNGAKCVDLLANYSCECAPGYEGRNCSTEINECDLYKACANNATCTDKVADYSCTCSSARNSRGQLFGGRNCTVELIACNRSAPCGGYPGAVCVPRVDNETIHSYTCVCPPGRTGDRCQFDSALSFSAVSSLTLNLTELRSLTFDFRTTLDDTMLLSLPESNFTLSLVGGKISINSGIPQGPKLVQQSSPWIKVSIVNATVLQVPGLNVSLEPFLVPANESAQGLGKTLFGPGYTGCLRDVASNGTILQPDIGKLSLVMGNDSVVVGCNRTEQCKGNPCGIGTRASRCIDLWVSYRCVCVLGREGDTCERNTTVATFGFNNATSYLRYSVSDRMRKFITDRRGFSLRLLIQAWPPSGATADSLLAYFGATKSTTPVYYLVLLLTASGHLKVVIEASKSFSNTSTLMVATGAPQQVSVSLSEEPVLTVSAAGVGEEKVKLDPAFKPSVVFSAASVIYIAGFKDSKTAPYSYGHSRVKRDTGVPVDELPAAVKSYEGFRGVMHDARTVTDVRLLLGNGTAVADKSLLPSVEVGVKAGVKTEDVCAISKPCLNGTCANVPFNSFKCTCAHGWRGVTCKFVDYCNSTITYCPPGYNCANVPEQPYYECSGSISMTASSPQITFIPKGSPAGVNVTEATMRIRTRTSTPLTLLSLKQSGTQVGGIDLLNSGIIQANRKSGSATTALNSTFKVNTGAWILFKVNFRTGKMAITLTTTTNSFQTVADDGLGIPSVTSVVLLPNQKFKGCISSVHVNGFPFALHTSFINSTEGGDPKWSPKLDADIRKLLDTNKGVCQQDPVCNPSPCNSGNCTDLWNAYQCQCTTEYSGTNCSQPVCAAAPPLQPHSACLNNGKCLANASDFSCSCAEGYIGYRCAGLNPCTSSPCKNGATCLPIIKVDGHGTVNSVVELNCNCTAGWRGPRCTTGTNQASVNYALIFSLVGAILLIFIIILIILIVRHIRTARSTRGMYDPHAQEMNGSHVYMANVIKPPPSERLI